MSLTVGRRSESSDYIGWRSFVDSVKFFHPIFILSPQKDCEKHQCRENCNDPVCKSCNCKLTWYDIQFSWYLTPYVASKEVQSGICVDNTSFTGYPDKCHDAQFAADSEDRQIRRGEDFQCRYCRDVDSSRRNYLMQVFFRLGSRTIEDDVFFVRHGGRGLFDWDPKINASLRGLRYPIRRGSPCRAFMFCGAQVSIV